ncbi:MAG TPA: hypothetical protein VHQ66_05385 [Myxococcota bacterium]|nr:hypothetical protein [Myxococcota bacterium]
MLVPVAAFLLLEGGSSLALLVLDAAGSGERPLARLQHTRYDPELGWSHVPAIRVDDLYGPGGWLETNRQGFRADHEYAPEVPPGRLRVVCSGDSFTLGYGVANDQTWCARLEALDARLESVNMGQAGYGIDQAYLWYRRDGAPLAHDVHVFAFILDDFRRMQETSFLGYGKPVLAVRNGALAVENTPVPQRRFYAGLGERLAHATGGLRARELLGRLTGRGDGARPPVRPAAPAQDPVTLELVGRVLDELEAANRAKGSQLVLLALPTPPDYRGKDSDAWRAFAAREAAARGIAYLDLVEGLRRMSRASVEPLFIKPGALPYRAAVGHLTPLGNDWVARQLYDYLLAAPALASRWPAGAGR